MQFSLFGAAVAEPSLDDLGGVLLAGGQWVRDSRGAARLSVVVADGWRADALARAFDELQLADVPAVVGAEDGLAARTCFTRTLAAPAADWIRGANQGPPARFALTAGGLRLWAIATGRHDEAGHLLGTAHAGDPVHRVAGSQLSRLGLAATSLTERGGGPGWRVTSTRRLRRLAELVGDAPAGSGPHWPRLTP